VKARLQAARVAAGFIAIGIAGVFDAVGYTILPKELRK
jgi:hypothetical protein